MQWIEYFVLLATLQYSGHTATPASACRVLTRGERQDFSVRTPQELRSTDKQDTVVAEHEYDGESFIAVDFGRNHADLVVDIVGSTAIVVTDNDQFDFALPSEASGVTTNNGVVTIEG